MISMHFAELLKRFMLNMYEVNLEFLHIPLKLNFALIAYEAQTYFLWAHLNFNWTSEEKWANHF